ncbi:hypothetical protein ACYSUO_40895 [Streptomyces sp. UC4497]
MDTDDDVTPDELVGVAGVPGAVLWPLSRDLLFDGLERAVGDATYASRPIAPPAATGWSSWTCAAHRRETAPERRPGPVTRAGDKGR